MFAAFVELGEIGEHMNLVIRVGPQLISGDSCCCCRRCTRHGGMIQFHSVPRFCRTATTTPTSFIHGLAKYVAEAFTTHTHTHTHTLPPHTLIPRLQIAAAVDYLHTRTPPIAHRDIKLANVLVDKDGDAKVVNVPMNGRVLSSEELCGNT